MRHFDGARTLHYVDPPYVHATRSGKRIGGALYNAYAHELSDADHADLCLLLRQLEGMVVLSGYPNPIYDALLGDWRAVERAALADGARPRVERLWLNPAAADALDRDRAEIAGLALGCAA